MLQTYFGLCIICLPMLFLIIMQAKKQKFNIYNKFNGQCFATGFTSVEHAREYLIDHFGDVYSYESVKNDFIIDTQFTQRPIFDDYQGVVDPIVVVKAPIVKEEYQPKTPYYKNRIAKYFDNIPERGEDHTNYAM